MTAGAGERASAASASRVAPPRQGARAFADALARARLARAPLAAGGDGSGGREGLVFTLRKRRAGADGGDARLERRREEGEPTAGVRPERPAGVGPPADAPAAADASGPLLSPAALERIAIEAGRVRAGSFVEVGFGRDVRVRIAAGRQGVEVLVSAARPRVAAAELPSIVRAIRARGVQVARAEVRGGVERGERRGVTTAPPASGPRSRGTGRPR